jgi:hypothetical protein
MSQLVLQAEITKLARLLGVAEKKVEFLMVEDVQSLRALRAACSAAMFQGDAKMFTRLAAASKLMPSALAAIIAHKAIGPVLNARVAGLVDPDKAVDISKRLPIPFLADVSAEIDPRSAGPLLRKMPVQVNVDVGMELLRRKEYIALARFVEDVTDECIQAIMTELPDDAILRIGAYVESNKRMDELIAMLSDDRLQGTVRAAVAEPNVLWVWTLSIMESVSPKARRRLGDIALKEQGAIESMAKALKQQGLWDSMLAISKDMSKSVQAKYAAAA